MAERAHSLGVRGFWFFKILGLQMGHTQASLLSDVALPGAAQPVLQEGEGAEAGGGGGAGRGETVVRELLNTTVRSQPTNQLSAQISACGSRAPAQDDPSGGLAVAASDSRSRGSLRAPALLHSGRCAVHLWHCPHTALLPPQDPGAKGSCQI